MPSRAHIVRLTVWALLFSSGALLAGCSPSSRPGGGGDAVVIHRPVAVGNRFIQSGEVQVTIGMTITARGRTVEDEFEEVRARFTIEREVEAVSAGGEATRLRSRVRSFSATTNGTLFDPVGPGSVVETLAAAGEMDHTGLPMNLSDGERVALDAVFASLVSTSRMDQAMFRSPEAVSVGQEWPIDLELIRREFSNEVLDLRSTKFAGVARLVDLRTVGGIECLHVGAHAEGEGVTMRGMPPGTVVDNSTLFFSYGMTLPKDSTRRVRDAQLMLSSNLSASIRNEGTVAGVYAVRADYTFEYPSESM